MKNRTVLLIAAATLAAAPLSKALANHTAIEYGGIETAGLKPVCRPAPQFGSGYHLCFAGDVGDSHESIVEGAGISALPADRAPQKSKTNTDLVAGPFRFCPSTDWAGTGYGITCYG